MRPFDLLEKVNIFFVDIVHFNPSYFSNFLVDLIDES
jgi:hypothetical protein